MVLLLAQRPRGRGERVRLPVDQLPVAQAVQQRVGRVTGRVVLLPLVDAVLTVPAGEPDLLAADRDPEGAYAGDLAQRPAELGEHPAEVVGILGSGVAAAEIDLGDPLVGDRHRQPGVDRRQVGAGDPLQVLGRLEEPVGERGGQLVATGDEDRLGHQDLAGPVEEVQRDLDEALGEPVGPHDQGVARVGDAVLAVLQRQVEVELPLGLRDRAQPGAAGVEAFRSRQLHRGLVAGHLRRQGVGEGDHRLTRLPCRAGLLGEELLGDADLDRPAAHRGEEPVDDVARRRLWPRGYGVDRGRLSFRGVRGGIALVDRTLVRHPDTSRDQEREGE